MIPLRDSIPSRTFPVVNTLLIVVNVLVFLFEVSMGPQALNRFIFVFGAGRPGG
jgi:membrane associated rhomboid family serine protease